MLNTKFYPLHSSASHLSLNLLEPIVLLVEDILKRFLNETIINLDYFIDNIHGKH